MENKDVIIACDFNNREDTLNFLNKFKDEKPFIKIGMELFYSQGISFLEKLKKQGYRIFLDLKLKDIPNTVKKSMEVLGSFGVDIVNVHATGSIKMMEYAKEGLDLGFEKLKKEKGENLVRPKLIAVTYLTSIDQQVLQNELLIREDISLNEAILNLAKNAKKAKLDGVVCSPLEASLIHEELGQDFLTVTPGIRYESLNDDQKRVVTPADARKLGSDYIVVGRPITKSSDPVSMYKKIKREFLGE